MARVRVKSNSRHQLDQHWLVAGPNRDAPQ